MNAQHWELITPDGAMHLTSTKQEAESLAVNITNVNTEGMGGDAWKDYHSEIEIIYIGEK